MRMAYRHNNIARLCLHVAERQITRPRQIERRILSAEMQSRALFPNCKCDSQTENQTERRDGWNVASPGHSQQAQSHNDADQSRDECRNAERLGFVVNLA